MDVLLKVKKNGKVVVNRTVRFGSAATWVPNSSVRFGSAHFKSQFGSAELVSFAEPNRTFLILTFLKIILKLQKTFLARFARTSSFTKNKICFPLEDVKFNYRT